MFLVNAMIQSLYFNAQNMVSGLFHPFKVHRVSNSIVIIQDPEYMELQWWSLEPRTCDWGMG